jgi:hypothetical protein
VSLVLAGYFFKDHPYDLDSSEAVIPKNRAVVYVIFSSLTRKVIDVGQSDEAGVRLADHDRRPCWERHCMGKPHIYLYYTPTDKYTVDDRRAIESKIRERYKPPCGSI